MVDHAWLFPAAISALIGMGLLALSLETHWRQVSLLNPPGGRRKTLLRTLGYANLGLSLVFCLRADHPSMAALVWVMFLAGAAFAIGMLLALSPWLLRPLSRLFAPKNAC